LKRKNNVPVDPQNTAVREEIAESGDQETRTIRDISASARSAGVLPENTELDIRYGLPTVRVGRPIPPKEEEEVQLYE